jgi:thiol-disulfide isomerase/thioredoxin
MQSLLEKALPTVAAWGVWILAAFLVAALFVTWRLGRGRRFLIPAHWPGRIGSVGSIGVAVVSAFGLFCLMGPMRPMLDQVRSIESAVGRPAADIDFRLVSDQTPGRLSELRGRVVLVNLWATWCPPCRHELPEINRLQQAYADRGLVVVTLSNEERDLLLRFAAQHPFTTVNVYASQLGWLDVPGRPLSIVIDREGVVRECIIGARSYVELRDKVERHLSARS